MAHDYELSLRHVDTCLPCYVLDHCNGDDECLIGVSVDRSSRYHHVRAELIREACGDEKMPAGITDEMVAAVVREEFSTAHPFATFDSALEKRTEDDGDECYAWFRFTWINPEHEEV